VRADVAFAARVCVATRSRVTLGGGRGVDGWRRARVARTLRAMRSARIHRSTAVALVLFVILVLAAVGEAKVRLSSENNPKLGPRDNAGQFLGSPTATYEWHGCIRTATAHLPQALAPGATLPDPGKAQRHVTFTVNAAAPFFTWKVKKGWKICGVEISAELANPTVRSDLLGEAGYTSGATSGSTAKSGRETIKVKIRKNAINEAFREFEGKTYAIAVIQDVTVFVKKRR
jgi:hypothetical protein